MHGLSVAQAHARSGRAPLSPLTRGGHQSWVGDFDCCLPQSPRSSTAFLRAVCQGPCSATAQQCDLGEVPHLCSPTCKTGSRPRAQDSVRPRKRPTHGLAVGAASLPRSWSVCLTCSAGGLGGVPLAQAGKVEGTSHPRGKTGWRWEIPGHKLTNSTFAVGLTPPRAPRHPRCHHTALKEVSSL